MDPDCRAASRRAGFTGDRRRTAIVNPDHAAAIDDRRVKRVKTIAGTAPTDSDPIARAGQRGDDELGVAGLRALLNRHSVQRSKYDLDAEFSIDGSAAYSGRYAADLETPVDNTAR